MGTTDLEAIVKLRDKFAHINVISLAIKSGLNIFDLSKAEMVYCPMLAENYDVLNKAADFTIRKFEKKK